MIRQARNRQGQVVAAVLLLAPGWAGAQTVVDEVEVSVIELDVSVRDRRGRSVAGLARESFAVSLAGVALEITNFRAVAGTAAAAEKAAEQVPLAALEPRHLVLYFDESSLDGGERAALARRLVASLAGGLAPGARIMVAGRHGSELRIYQPFTESPELLTAAVDAAVRAAPRNAASAEMSELLREIEHAVSKLEEAPRVSGRAQSRVLAARSTSFVSEALQRVARSAEVFEQLVRLQGGLPGRKAILYVGDGLAVNPGELLGAALRDAFGRFALSSMSDFIDSTSTASLGGGVLGAVAESAASRQVVVYALDTTGSEALPMATAEYRSIDAGRSGGAAPSDTWTPAISSWRRSELRSALGTIAEATGGTVFTDRRRDVLGPVVEDLGTYYSLGVAAPQTATPLGELEVTVKDRGLRVHHRRAARPRSIDEVDADRTVAALLAGDESDSSPANPLGARVTIGEITEAGEAICVVPLTVSVPVAAMMVVARNRVHEGQLSVFVATRDARRHMSDVRKVVLPVSLANSALATAVGRQAEYRLELSLPVGPARIAVGVRDDLDPVLTLLMLDVEVGAGAPLPPS
ncbi:MAG: VWA domain-containing protein [Acidobacteria bacterium]|nr:VWA domain-containing protein [Acidobacteriota bacterium]